MTQAQRDRVVEEARKLLGVPFVHAGRSANGLDCVGLLVLATRNAGMEAYDNTDYSPVVNSERMQAELAAGASRLEHGSALQKGDVLLFTVGTSPQHLAMLTQAEPAQIIHSYQTVGRVVEHALDGAWLRRLVSAWSWGAR